MSISRLVPSVACVALAGVLGAQATMPRVVPNDNTRPAGRYRGDTLVVALVARTGDWRPSGATAPGAPMFAFAEEGGGPRIPGPLVRVHAGTPVEVTVRNTLGDTLRVHGLVDRRPTGPIRADTTPLVVAPGARATARLRLAATGTWLYWATTTRRPIDWRTGLDAQLTGAIVVDSAHADPARPRDHVLVLGSWSDTVHRMGTLRTRVLAVVNGRSWPHTERLAYAEGDTVRLRIVNGTADLHPIHLHGNHFVVSERREDLPTAEPFPPGAPTVVVTEPVSAAGTFTLTWVPTRAGNWLLHCHVPEHFAPRGPLGTMLATPVVHDTHAADHALGGMGGMVVGLTVRPRAGTAVARAAAAPRGERRMRLLVRETVGSTDAAPTFAYALHEGTGPEPAPDTGLAPSPALDLVQGEPVAITVVNRLREPTAVHWHGIELDPYYDGVPGFSGWGRRTTPMIAPADSFTVHFAPPRAGTFIYHTHADEVRQQAAGLAGPLLVRAPGTVRDPVHDVAIVLTSPIEFALNDRVVLFNGRRTPAPLVMTAGQTYRLRLVQMSVHRSGLTVRLNGRDAGARDSLLTWRMVAKDGADLPPAVARVPITATQRVSVGETMDFEVTPTAPGEMKLDVMFGFTRTGRPAARVTHAGTYPIRVVAPVAQARPGLVDDLLHEIAQAESKMLALANAMPDAAWDWRPGAGVRSTREVLVHVAGENYYAAAKWGERVAPGTGISGTTRAETDAYERRPAPSRAEALAALTRSFALLREGLAALPDSALARPTVYARETIATRTAWVRTATHLHEHLGQLIAYARSNGVVPPWSAPGAAPSRATVERRP